MYPRDLNDFSSSEEECTPSGDANSDGIVNVVDVVLTINFIFDVSTPNSEEFCAVEINGDGVINVVDVVLIINIIFFLKKWFV